MVKEVQQHPCMCVCAHVCSGVCRYAHECSTYMEGDLSFSPCLPPCLLSMNFFLCFWFTGFQWVTCSTSCLPMEPRLQKLKIWLWPFHGFWDSNSSPQIWGQLLSSTEPPIQPMATSKKNIFKYLKERRHLISPFVIIYYEILKGVNL